MAGKLNRYGNFGEVREGWLADLLLIEGDPFTDISILERPEESLMVIMKRPGVETAGLESVREETLG